MIEQKQSMSQRNRYTDEFKRDVLEMVASGERSIPQLERDLGITPGLIYKWRDRYQVEQSNGSLRPSQERAAEAEIRRLKRELAIVKQERDILKKAIRVFSRDQQP